MSIRQICALASASNPSSNPGDDHRKFGRLGLFGSKLRISMHLLIHARFDHYVVVQLVNQLIILNISNNWMRRAYLHSPFSVECVLGYSLLPSVSQKLPILRPVVIGQNAAVKGQDRAPGLDKLSK